LLTKLISLELQSNKLTGSLPSEFDKLTELGSLSIGENFLTGTLPKQIQSLDLSSIGFDKQFCQVCSEGLIPESTTTNFTLKGNFSCTDMFNIHNNNNLPTIDDDDSYSTNEFLTMDQCVSFKKECVNCVDEKKDLILS